jgi:hypothetical protein
MKNSTKLQILIVIVSLIALSGQLFISLKMVEIGLWIWLITNPFIVWVNLKKRLYGFALLFFGYEVFVVVGLLNWHGLL